MMDLEDAGATVRHLIRDRDAKFPALFDEILADAGITADVHEVPATLEEEITVIDRVPSHAP
jgi:hypothetical protein